MPCPVLTGFNAIFGIACDVRSHYNFSLLLCTLTRKLHTTKLLLFSRVIPFWLISGRSHQGAPLEASRWLMSHLRHLHQHKAHLKIPWLLEIHTWSGLCLQGLAAARCCFITWNCWVFLSTDYSMQLVFTVSQKKLQEQYKEHFLTVSTPFTTRFCYKRFWNINAQQTWLPGIINHLARFSSSFNRRKIFLPGTEHSWANKLSTQGLQRGRG